jgi:hypothetical protein
MGLKGSGGKQRKRQQRLSVGSADVTAGRRRALSAAAWRHSGAARAWRRSAGSKAALDNFWKSTGGDFLLKQGTDQINANMYSRGLGKSGADMKGLENYRSGLASTKLNDLLQNYFGLAKLGLGAGSLVTDAGQYSKGTGATQGSLGSIMQGIGALAAFI